MGCLIEKAVMADIERAPTFPTSPSENHCVFRLTELHHLPGTQQALITYCNDSADFWVMKKILDGECRKVWDFAFFCLHSDVGESCFMFVFLYLKRFSVNC